MPRRSLQRSVFANGRAMVLANPPSVVVSFVGAFHFVRFGSTTLLDCEEVDLYFRAAAVAVVVEERGFGREEFSVEVRLREVAYNRHVKIEQGQNAIPINIEVLCRWRREEDASEFVGKLGLVRFPIGFGGLHDDSALRRQWLDVIATGRRGDNEDLLSGCDPGEQLGEVELMDVRAGQIPPRVFAIVMAVSDDDEPEGVVRTKLFPQLGDRLFKLLARRSRCGFEWFDVRVLRIVAEQKVNVLLRKAQLFGKTLVQFGRGLHEQLAMRRASAQPANDQGASMPTKLVAVGLLAAGLLSTESPIAAADFWPLATGCGALTAGKSSASTGHAMSINKQVDQRSVRFMGHLSAFANVSRKNSRRMDALFVRIATTCDGRTGRPSYD